MTVKYLHLRAMDEDGYILPKGGVTVAYVLTEIEGMQHIYVAPVKCHPNELFCYKTGRELAAKRLKDEGPTEVLDLEHPISETIVDWICNSWWPIGPKSREMGFAIDAMRDERMRWVSDFYPSQNEVSFQTEEDWSSVQRNED
jgi:hypothetical protein